MKRHSAAAKITYPAILGALSLIFVYVGAVAPSGNWGFVALAGLFPAAVVISFGLKSGFLCWAGVSVLAFVLLPGKFCAMLYVVLFGLYPMLKSLIEGLRIKVLGYVLKLVFFNAAFTVLYTVMRIAVLDSLPDILETGWIIYLVGNAVFLVYDFGFSKLIAFYIARIARGVK